MKSGRPPAVAAAILEAFLPVNECQAIPGDLEEEYRSAALPRWGATGAGLWYWRQVLGSIPSLVRWQWAEAGWARLGLAVFVGYLAVAVPVVLLERLAGLLFPPPDGSTPGLTYMLFDIGCGFAASAFGGFVAGWIGRGSPMLHAVAFCGFCAMMGVISFVELAGRAPLWYRIALFLTFPPGALLGAFLRARFQRKEQS